jgi:hypothetical protein
MRWLPSFALIDEEDVSLHRRRARPRARQPLERTGRSRARPLGRSDSDRPGSIGAASRWAPSAVLSTQTTAERLRLLHSTHSRTGASRRGRSLFDLLKGAGRGQRSSSRCAPRFSVSVTRERTAMRLSRRLTPSRSGRGHPRPGRPAPGRSTRPATEMKRTLSGSKAAALADVESLCGAAASDRRLRGHQQRGLPCRSPVSHRTWQAGHLLPDRRPAGGAVRSGPSAAARDLPAERHRSQDDQPRHRATRRPCRLTTTTRSDSTCPPRSTTRATCREAPFVIVEPI